MRQRSDNIASNITRPCKDYMIALIYTRPAIHPSASVVYGLSSSPKSQITSGGFLGLDEPEQPAVHLLPCAAGKVQVQLAAGSMPLSGCCVQPAVQHDNRKQWILTSQST
jgi:hypothetical protein